MIKRWKSILPLYIKKTNIGQLDFNLENFTPEFYSSFIDYNSFTYVTTVNQQHLEAML